MILILIFLTSFLSSGSQAEILRGVAKNDQGKILYLEKLDIQKDEAGLNRFIRVEYLRPDGALFATMTSDFSKNQFVPDTAFEDKRFYSKVTLRVIGDSVEFEEFKNGQSISKKRIPLKGSMVASQGFDNYIKKNLATLSSQPMEFKFGVLEKKDFFSLTGYRRAPSSPQEIEFGIRASSWVVRLFVEELRIAYDSKDMRLKSFMGRSNIFDDTGKGQDVIIRYQWDHSAK